MPDFIHKGDIVRFRRHVNKPGSRWSTGRFWEMNLDGSLAIVDDKTRRTVHRFPEDVQAQGEGPKGGSIWVDLVMETVV